MYLSIITLPLIASIVSGFLGRKVGVRGSQLVGCISIVLTSALSLLAFLEVGLNNIPVTLHLFRWVESESLNLSWSFYFDSLTVSMLIPVLIISSLVHIYSIGYMSSDPHNQRFFSYLSLFTFMMIILITSDSYLVMFVGWEGVGVCSYLLVSFWYTRIAANNSSISALLTNRVGDCFLTIGMFAILWSFGNIDYSTVFSLAPFMSNDVVTIIGICLLIGAMAKSSQIGLHVWLPMAMEGLKRALLKFFYMRENTLILKSTSYFVAIGKIFNIVQSAGNLFDIQGSSETTRETIKLNDNFNLWLIGFAEGKGHFCVKEKNKKKIFTFKITHSTVDSQVLFLIKKQLGFGKVCLQSTHNKTHQYIVKDIKSLKKIIEIFNGNLLTKAKIAQFKSFLEEFNSKYSTSILFIECKKKVTLDNPWLSGFTDADGCFTCSAFFSKVSDKHIVTVRYIISKKNDIEFSEHLAKLINGYITHIKSYNGYNTVVNHSKLNIILKYIKTYPLKTKKHLSYFKWYKVYNLVKNKDHLNLEGLEKIKSLIKKINK